MRSWIIACAVLLAACTDAARPAQDAANDVTTATLAPADLPGFFDCLRDNGQTIVSAHRGGPAPGFAENAIPTFAHTLSQGPAFLEIDIAVTRDDQLVLMHDDDAERTTTGEGRISALTLAELQSFALQDDSGATLNAHAPTLREALDWAAGKTVLELDVKRGVSYEDVVAAVVEAGAMNRVIFVTYSVDGAARIARLAPQAMLYVTVSDVDDLDALTAQGVDLEHVIAWTGTEEPSSGLNVALAARGVEARFGTLGGRSSWDARFARDGAEQYAAFADTGLQIIATDRPAEAARDLDAHDGVVGFGAAQCLSAAARYDHWVNEG